ncbi:hypothetical protein [Solidesulfovibrio carbinolicus]|uniref:Glycosyl transferase n=1 Tax=Solidesulfovibrio carbinolicus TaxID=296842 RepID=A0A4P6HP97_9BACT|nr:hypothetical protein [Solidesulfovibrio carbinolicus]QAZ69101.1 hypothetical protein C3Y92_18405 [Solidesulfovibrio carbinolicus]
MSVPAALAVSFVVDAQPKFRLQAFNLLATLLGSGTVLPQAVQVHLVGEHPPDFVRFLAGLGVVVVPTKPYGAAASPYCNKLTQLRSKALAGADHVALLDADVAVTGDLSLELPGPGARGKIVDTAAPPLPLLRALLRAAGLPRDAATATAGFGPGQTLAANLNGGVTLFDRETLAAVGPRWLKWTHFTLENARLLGPYAKHADQVGLALALIDLGLPPGHLPDRLNFPTHLRPASYRPEHDQDAAILHYHHRLDDDGCLTPLGLPRIDAAQARANALIRDFQLRHGHKAGLEALLAHWRRSCFRP